MNKNIFKDSTVMKRRVTLQLMAAGALGASGLPLLAQVISTNKNLRMIVPFPPGGGTDAVARALALRLSAVLGQTVVVDNKAGAGTTIGLAEVARAAPDGYTVGIGGTSDPLLPLLYDNLPFNPTQDLVFVSTLASSPIALAVGNNVPVRNIAEFISHAKSKSSSPLAYASVGIASPQHLAGIHFSAMTGAPLIHAPYRGTGPALNDLLGGHVPAAMLGLPSLLPHARNGKLRILGVASATRSQLASDIPTIAESGVNGFEAGFWYHVVVPRGTPVNVIQALRLAIDRVISSSEMKTYLSSNGFEALTLSPEESSRALKLETEKWSRIIRENNIRGT
jgi:tripartite-type tricarboxylate transporter receptor subunit TctC